MLLTLGVAFTGSAQDVCTRAKNLFETINNQHLLPQTTNDNFSERVFATFLEQLDPEQNYFTKKDSVWLRGKFLPSFNQGISDGGCSFFQVLTSFFNQKLLSYQQFADSALKLSPGYSSVQNASGLIGKSESFAPDYASLKKRRMAWLKLRILSRSWRIADAKGVKLGIANFNATEKEARAKMLLRSRKSLDRMLQAPEGFAVFVETLLMRAICQSYDPHTEYFTAAEMKSFQSALSTSEISFGFELTESATGAIQVARLMPGGPAWKSDAIKTGDVLLSMKPGTKSVMDASDFELDEILAEVADMTNLEASFTVKSPDGKIKSVTLKKEKIENAENLITSFVLEGKRKIGYIQLPGFYTNETLEVGKGCAGDVAKELLKLKKEGIEALILDLRFNGGGSVQEAIELGGIFIDAGPLAVMEGNDGQVVTLKDFNRGSAYTGPLLVMINALSASASEIVAAGLQDYNRAIIMGCESYGKATGQVVIPLKKDKGDSDFVKITEDRIYRVTGSSLQLNGVVPDITVPEITAAFGQREVRERYAIQPKSITKKIYFTPLAPLNLAEVKAKSETRLKPSPYFQSIEKFGAQFATPVPLEMTSFIRFIGQLEESANNLSAYESDSELFKVHVSGLNQALFTVDTYHKEISESALEELQSSQYVREAYSVLCDYLSLNPKP